MGFGPPAHRCTILHLGEELKEWVIVKIKLTKHKRNEKFGSDTFGRGRIYIIPLFYHSIIPCVRQACQASDCLRLSRQRGIGLEAKACLVIGANGADDICLD